MPYWLVYAGGRPLDAVSYWTQQYDPFGSWQLSTLVAGLPVVMLLGLLATGKVSAWQAALAGLATALGGAVFAFGMPWEMALASAGYGMVFALFRIIWLIVAAVFLYDIAVATGQFEIMKESIARLSPDRRIQAILVAFSFGAFIEGAAGFGAPVAISAAFLTGLGFEPFRAALLCLIANTAPVAWGAIGTPIRTLAAVTELDVHALSATAGRILPFLSLIVPVWLVRTMTDWKRTLEVAPALLVVGGSFAAAQWAWSNFVSFELVDIISSVASLYAGVLLLKRWQPRTIWRFHHDAEGDAVKLEAAQNGARHEPLPRGKVLRAWMPFALLTGFVMIWGVPQVNRAIDSHTSWKPPMPGLVRVVPGAEGGGAAELVPLVAKGFEITGNETPRMPTDFEKANLEIVPIASTGMALFLAAITSGLLLGVDLRGLAQMFGKTAWRLRTAIAAILCMLGLGFVTKYSGMDAVLGLAFTRTGPLLYPIFGTFLGWLGVALTGSDTSSNVLFGNLQKITAQKLGLNPILMASANSTGGVMGKMIDAQSIVVAAAATGETGHEGALLRAVVGHSIALALIVSAIVWVYAHLMPWAVAVPIVAGP